MRPLLALLRPRQWYKNALLLVPLLFAGHADDLALWPRALLAFVAFCALSSSVYAANDVLDAPRDRNHPRKATRPVASGAIAPRQALLVAAVLAAAGLALLALLDTLTLLIGGLYLLLQALYTTWLKHTLLWDAMCIALGFVLRALAGTTAIAIGPPTEWLIVCTFLLALYLALAKRRHELMEPESRASPALARPALALYTPAFTQQAMATAATLLLASYTMYTFFGTTRWMMFTLPFAFYGVFRHAWLLERRASLGDDAQMILADKATVANAAVWALVVAAVLAGIPQRFVAWVAHL